MTDLKHYSWSGETYIMPKTHGRILILIALLAFSPTAVGSKDPRHTLRYTSQHVRSFMLSCSTKEISKGRFSCWETSGQVDTAVENKEHLKVNNSHNSAPYVCESTRIHFGGNDGTTTANSTSHGEDPAGTPSHKTMWLLVGGVVLLSVILLALVIGRLRRFLAKRGFRSMKPVSEVRLSTMRARSSFPNNQQRRNPPEIVNDGFELSEVEVAGRETNTNAYC